MKAKFFQTINLVKRHEDNKKVTFLINSLNAAEKNSFLSDLQRINDIIF